MNDGYADKTCRSCRHWQPEPMPRGPAVVGQRQGQCREQPRVMLALIQLPNGSPAIQNTLGYFGVPAEFPACGRHVPLLEVGLADG